MSLPLLQPGTRIGGQYVVDTLINRGGFGAVYRGYDAGENNRLCAIKETYDVSPAARRRALREVGILFTVKNQHLPEVYDTFEDNGRFYVVMQLIEGQNLLQMLLVHGRPFSEQRVLAWLLPIMDVLQELHSRPSPVIHRDIKPANIIIAPQQCAVLVDFGLTKLYSPEDTTQTIERAVSHGFSPIEQYLGTTSPQSDIYSLAATMYVLLTNVTPPSSMQRNYRDELIDPSLLNPAISPNVERALLRALALMPENRFQSMQAFAQALREPAFHASSDRAAAPRATAIPGVQPSPTRQNIEPGHVALPSLPAVNGQHPIKNTPAVKGTARAGAKGVNGGKNARPYAGVHSIAPQQGTRQPTGRVVLPARPLPGAFNQGCLWGSLQGVLAALIVLLLRKEADFYTATALGFVFYFIAGFLTARKGGRSSRGATAGFWAGISSTLVFWLMLVIGLFVLVLQRSLTVPQPVDPPRLDLEFYRAWRLVMPVVYNHPIVQMQPVPVITLFLASGLLLAIGFGWIGGILAKESYKAHTASVRAKRSA